MQITKENLDSLNAVVKLHIEKSDYSEKVDKILKDYRKTATVPGFRKGHVPMGMIKRQYGQAVLADEVNKLIQQSLNNYLTKEKLNILGSPIPQEQPDFSWDNEDYTFEFEIGLAPEINIDYNNKKAITHYKISADKEMIDDQIKLIQRQFGKLVSQTEVKEGFTLVGKFTNEEEEIENETSFKLVDIQGKKNKNSFIGAKIGDTIQVNTKGLFEKEDQLANFLGIDKGKAENLSIDVNFEISEINEEVSHELNQDLYDKYTREEGKITSEEELKNFIKEQAAEQFVQHSDQQLQNDTTEYLLDTTKFDLPAKFLKKWLKTSGETQLSEEEAKEEYEKSEKGIRYQLIESKIITENDIQVKAEEIKDMMKKQIKMQMAQYGGAAFPEEQMEGFANQMLSNKEEARKVSEQVMSNKILNLMKEKLNLEEKEVSFKQFADEAYK